MLQEFNWRHYVGTALLFANGLIGKLGDTDTVCASLGLVDPNYCGSRALIGTILGSGLLEPAITLAAIYLILLGERKAAASTRDSDRRELKAERSRFQGELDGLKQAATDAMLAAEKRYDESSASVVQQLKSIENALVQRQVPWNDRAEAIIREMQRTVDEASASAEALREDYRNARSDLFLQLESFSDFQERVSNATGIARSPKA